MRRRVYFLQACLASIFAICISLCMTIFVGENPWNIFQIFWRASSNSWYDFGMMLAYSTPLIFTGLSVSIAYKAGLFNIGAEGQLVIGAIAATTVATLLPLPFWIAPFVAGVTAFTAGALWGAIPGFLKVQRGAHEVISTIMLNFVAAGLASYFTIYTLRDTSLQTPQTVPILPEYLLRHNSFFEGAPVNVVFWVTMFVFPSLCGLFLSHTGLGYSLRAVGSNENACGFYGISVKRIQVLAMAFAGGLAGLVGVTEVLGRSGTFRLDFSPGYGFTGIAVAFLARGNPYAVVFSALLFGFLQKGAGDLEIFSTYVTSDMALVLQGLIILLVSASRLWGHLLPSSERKVSS